MNKNQIKWVFNRKKDDKAIVRHLSEGIMTRIFVGNQSMLSFVHLAPHTKGEVHQHPEEQWGILLEGKCIRNQDQKEVEMQVGDF